MRTDGQRDELRYSFDEFTVTSYISRSGTIYYGQQIETLLLLLAAPPCDDL